MRLGFASIRVKSSWKITFRIDGRGEGQEPERGRVSPGVQEVGRVASPLVDGSKSALPESESPRTNHRTERVIMFRVPWQDDAGEIHVNRGFRVQMKQRDRPVQRRAAISSHGQSRHSKISRVRAGV